MNPNMTYKENKDIETRLRNENATMRQALEEIANMDAETGHYLSDAIQCAKEAQAANEKWTP
jgi:bifunctional N-acetylglucosamine-1-phosphate-uridyltransferase/glucosamine-1-phosphate-acetyltransferase GlmU-like protein